ncbi:MAG: TrmH family RNA methyltransferase [bacterium]|nr:TrmH family RNA methyltransferase [bacterium]
MREMIIIAHDMRSTFNVGSLLRTSEGMGIKKVYLTGYTPYPKMSGDSRLPHLIAKLDKQINKTALGAEHYLDWEYNENIFTVIDKLEEQKYKVAALEQSNTALELHKFSPPNKFALILGNEVSGISEEILNSVKLHLSIPMQGRKESFNVVIAAAMAMYQSRFY